MTEAEYAEKALKKNKLSAAFFLAGAVVVFLITALFIFVFMIVTGALQAVFIGTLGSRAADGSDALRSTIETFWLFVVFALAAFVPQIVAGIGMLKRKPWARTAGIVAFVVVLLTFTPVVLLLIYPLVFLLGNDGKYLYKTVIK